MNAPLRTPARRPSRRSPPPPDPDDLDADTLDRRYALHLQTQRGAACVRALNALMVEQPVRLDAETLAVLARRGYGHELVMAAVRLLVAHDRVRVTWRAHGLEGWASVESV